MTAWDEIMQVVREHRDDLIGRVQAATSARVEHVVVDLPTTTAALTLGLEPVPMSVWNMRSSSSPNWTRP